MNREIGDCIKLINEMMIKNGIALNDVITDIHEEVAKIHFPDKIKVSILMVRFFSEKFEKIENKQYFSRHWAILNID